MPDSCSTFRGRLSILKLVRGANRTSPSFLNQLHLDISIGLSLSFSDFCSSFDSSFPTMLYIASSFFTLNLKRIGTLSSRSICLISPHGSLLELLEVSKSSINLTATDSSTVDEVKAEKVIMFLRCSLN